SLPACRPPPTRAPGQSVSRVLEDHPAGRIVVVVTTPTFFCGRCHNDHIRGPGSGQPSGHSCPGRRNSPGSHGAGGGGAAGERVTVAGVLVPRAGEGCDMPELAALNALPPDDFEELLLGCCAAPGWARRVTEGRPYESLAAMLAAAGAAWAARDPGDLDAAIAGHPRIGERLQSGWSAGEQAGVGEDAAAPAAPAGANAPDERRGPA